MHLSVLIEIVLLLLWNKNDFKMIEPEIRPESAITAVCDSPKSGQSSLRIIQQLEQRSIVITPPTSVGGTLRGRISSGNTLGNILASDKLASKLRDIEDNLAQSKGTISIRAVESDHLDKRQMPLVLSAGTTKLECIEKNVQQQVKPIESQRNSRKSQFIIFKLIFNADGRLIKYLILFVMFGMLLAPMNFVFLSLDDVCKTKGYNFSQLAGAVLISQAFSETLGFFVVPWFLTRIPRSAALAFGVIILTTRYYFYATYYYTSNVSDRT